MQPASDVAPPSRAWRFLVLAVGASWLDWSLLAFAGPASPHALVTGVSMAGFLLVGITAVGMAGRSAGARLRELREALFDLRRIGALAWLAALFLFPLLALAAVALDGWQSGLAPAPGAVLHPPSALSWLRGYGFALLAGPLFEEIGWRGVALAPLQDRYGGLRGAALLGCVHALWHLPLFVLPVGYFHDLGVLTPAFWRFMADILVFDLIAAALFNATKSSVLAAAVLHATFNLAGMLWLPTPQADWYREALAAAVALVLAIGTRGRLFLDRGRR